MHSKLLWVLSLTLLLMGGPAPTSAQTKPGTVQALDDKYGFREVKFGTPLSAFSDLTPYKQEGDRQMYQRKKENLFLGKYRFNNITYTFYRGKLSAILCTVTGLDNVRGISQALQRAYGPGRATRTGKEWAGRRVKMQWMQWSDTQVFLSLESIPLLNERLAAEEKAAEKASSDL